MGVEFITNPRFRYTTNEVKTEAQVSEVTTFQCGGKNFYILTLYTRTAWVPQHAFDFYSWRGVYDEDFVHTQMLKRFQPRNRHPYDATAAFYAWYVDPDNYGKPNRNKSKYTIIH
jgi:hypothetical protein